MNWLILKYIDRYRAQRAINADTWLASNIQFKITANGMTLPMFGVRLSASVNSIQQLPCVDAQRFV